MADEDSGNMGSQPNYFDDVFQLCLSQNENLGQIDNVQEEPVLDEFPMSLFPGLTENELMLGLENASAIEVAQPLPSSSTYVPSSLQARHNWPGQYDFSVSFGAQETNAKGVLWTYSDIKDKLYVAKDKPCPINFSTNERMSEGVTVRAMLQYSSPEHAAKPVTRCYDHSMEELNAGVAKAQHLVRCDSKVALYEENPTNQHLSVVIPWENPQEGEPYSTYIYEFACFQSCSGGPNRRPLTLVFSLEKYNQVIGRRMLDLKICACPRRDRKADEKNIEPIQSSSSGPKRKVESTATTSLSDAFSFTQNVHLPSSKKKKEAPDAEGHYIVKTKSPECYNMLCQVKVLYDSCQAFRQHDMGLSNIKSEEDSE